MKADVRTFTVLWQPVHYVIVTIRVTSCSIQTDSFRRFCDVAETSQRRPDPVICVMLIGRRSKYGYFAGSNQEALRIAEYTPGFIVRLPLAVSSAVITEIVI